MAGVNGIYTRSSLELLAALQAHGLTQETLEEWAKFCEAGKSGTVTFHHKNGHMLVLEVHGQNRIIRPPLPCTSHLP